MIKRILVLLFLGSNIAYAEQVLPNLGYLEASINNKITPSTVEGKPLTYDMFTTLAREVWNELEYEPDNTENWEENPITNRGDCEDFVLALRKKLIDNDISNKYFSIIIVESDEANMNHAALLIETIDKGNFIFDNLGIHTNKKFKVIKMEVNNKWYK
jgi:hypothetical protein